jgi:hypothetical protein
MRPHGTHKNSQLFWKEVLIVKSNVEVGSTVKNKTANKKKLKAIAHTKAPSNQCLLEKHNHLYIYIMSQKQ